MYAAVSSMTTPLFLFAPDPADAVPKTVGLQGQEWKEGGGDGGGGVNVSMCTSQNEDHRSAAATHLHTLTLAGDPTAPWCFKAQSVTF